MTRDVCGVILLRPDGQALMQLRDAIPTITDPGMWVFPGGHCDAEEDHETCARREVFEETRYRCSDLRHLVTFPASQAGYPGDYELTFFWSMFDSRQGYECCEGQELRFVARSEAASLHMPAYVTGIWDLAIAAMAREQDFTAPTGD
jgi:8-oxo-dGTP pyrophosphatase MutT (NUDIX family)